MLRAVVVSITAHFRSYDLVIRFGGDEFVCALPDVTMAQAGRRFELVDADLAATQQASITVGLTELDADDAPQDLLARADEAMYKQRHQKRSPRALTSLRLPGRVWRGQAEPARGSGP